MSNILLARDYLWTSVGLEPTTGVVEPLAKSALWAMEASLHPLGSSVSFSGALP